MRTDLSIKLLRWALGFTFLWFGVLKLFNASPVLEIIRQAIPLMLGESQLFMFALSLLEIVIGLAFLANKFVKITIIVMTAYLFVTTVLVLFTQGFVPRFPVLSLAGEFVLKNLVLIASGLVLFSHHEQKEEKTQK